MTLDQALHQRCLDDGPLKALIGENLYPDVVPATATKPYVVRTVIANPAQDEMDGVAAYAEPTYQFTIVAATSEQREKVGRALKDCLERYAGGMGAFDVDILKLAESDDWDDRRDGSERVNFMRRIDLQVAATPVAG